MAPLRVPSRSRFHVERGLGRLLGRRSSLVHRNSSAPPAPPTAASSVPSPAKSGPTGVSLPPTGVAALIGIVVMLCVFIFAFAGWRIWMWRRNKRATSSRVFKKSTRPGVFSLSDAAYDSKCSVSPSSTIASVDLPDDAKTGMTHSHFVPESYKSGLNDQSRIIYAGSDALQEAKDTLPPSIIVSPTPPSSLYINLPPSHIQFPPPALSPRTASSMQNVRSLSRSDKFPRLVVVESTFSAKLHDELDIREGEILRLLAEYADEWCLVQRVGPPDSEKGVIPRFCVVDKPSVPPSKSKHISRLSVFSKI